MSINVFSEDKGTAGAGASTVVQAPKLRGAAHYAAWRRDMEVWLERHNANNVHSRAIDAKEWKRFEALVRQWGEEELMEAMTAFSSAAIAGSSSSSSSASTTTTKEKDSGNAPDAQAKQRKVLTLMVQHSHRVFGVLYSALPDELRTQAESVPRGFAYGLWHWLETKFQSTESDSVHELLEQWFSLRQEEDEQYDAYRARVNALYALLDAAKETPSAAMRSLILCERLTPRYKPVVLALKASGVLKDAKNIDWENVTAQINRHEREELRSNSDAVAAAARGAWANTAHTRNTQEQEPHAEWREKPKADSSTDCWNCQGKGHFQWDCSKPRQPREFNPNYKKSGSFNKTRSSSSRGHSRGHTKSAVKTSKAGSNRFEPLTDSGGSGDDWEQSGEQRAHAYVLIATPSPRSYAMVAAGKKIINKGPDSEKKAAALQAKRDAEKAAAEAESQKKRDKRDKQKEEKQKQKHSAITPELRAALDQTKADTAKRVAAEAEAAEAEKRKEKLRAVAAKPAEDRRVADPVVPTSYKQMDERLSQDAWGVDSMASVHVSGNRALFATLRKCSPVQIKTADGTVITANQSGTVRVRAQTDTGGGYKITVTDVLYHSSFTSNLLSAVTLTRAMGWTFINTPDESYLLTPTNKHRINLSRRGKITVLLTVGPERVYSAPVVSRRDVAKTAEWILLHQRLGHIGFDQLLGLVRKKRALGLGSPPLLDADVAAAREAVRECEACVLGKQSRTQWDHRGLDRGQRAGDIIHMDTYPVRYTDKDGLNRLDHAVTMKDAFSKEAWFTRVQTKDQVSSAVINRLNEIEQSGNKVRRLCMDGGSEFINQTLERYLLSRGIHPRVSPPNTQALNGIAESSVRMLKNDARTLLQHAAKAPDRLWHYATEHAVWIWNRTRISSATTVTPYEAAAKRPPNLPRKLIGVWGCDCFVHQHKGQRVGRGAMAAKSEPGIYLGHSERYNCANVLMLRTRKVVQSRDVRFFNNRFSYMKAYKRGTEAMMAILDGELDSDDGGDCSNDGGEAMPAQGGLEQPSAAEQKEDSGGSPRSADEDTENEYVVQDILGDRVRNGKAQYKVLWEGYDEPTWESAENIEACEALDRYEARQEAKPQLRQSQRNKPAVSASESDDTELDYDDENSGGVKMATVMKTLARLAPTDEWVDEEQLLQAFAAVAKESGSISDRTPKTLEEAMSSPDAEMWEAARKEEHGNMNKMKVWNIVERASLPPGTNVLPVKEVYKIKLDENGAIDKFKARYTPKGFRQIDGKDFNSEETRARTAMYKTERLALAICARFDNELYQFDVPAAFLNGDLKEKVYMELPKGFADKGKVAHLLKSIYGLKQAGHNWDVLVHSFIVDEMGWTPLVSDLCFYYKRSKTGRLMLIYRYVDDMQGQCRREDNAEFMESSDKLRERFNIKAMATATWMLGMRITRDREARMITLDQQLYVETALKRFGLEQCTSVSTPEAVGARTDKNPMLDEPAADRTRYMEITGTLMYAAVSTRLDISHAVHYLSSHLVAPTVRHEQAAERVLRYLSGTKEIGLVFGSRNSAIAGAPEPTVMECSAYADADWAGDHSDRKSTSGWVAMVNGDPISWRCKKQSVVALSTCEAELYAEAAAIQEVQWIRGILAELGLASKEASTVYGDNQSAIAEHVPF